ncbi:hypothetical protein G647_06721 [Cladophialophora carrionii CBS 160.54]|uniref:Uncharacterized protein n=1 Tax=Cladophialophora carrionii CBS 160.54 TaxID=1279043 RepID=V9D6Z2_9EURO|nr:uncharacterized protein G647_06721 [Cladophialophora carrionii CBS 160.54]ETI22645.1 hypothetical protein G647_06721 [Cladophialophora carrionii CBS 160.54]
MARPRTPHRRRTVSESEQREFVDVQQEHQQQQHDEQRHFDLSSSTQGLDGPIRRFQILKSTPVGLVCPQNIRFSVVDADAGIAQTGHIFDLSTPATEPIYVTNDLKWWKQRYFLPPSFEVFPGNAHKHGSRSQRTASRRVAQEGSEISGLPPSPPHDSLTFPDSRSRAHSTTGQTEKAYPVAEIKYRGWQGLTGMSVALTVYNITPEMHYHNHYSHALADDPDSTPDIRSRYLISRTGWKREYILTPGGYKWRSPSPVEKKDILAAPAVDDATPVGHGNLILEDADQTPVAVYKQRRDHEVLGTLTVLLQHVNETGSDGRNGHGQGHGHGHGHGKGNDGKITTEAVLASCLAVVTYERIGWQNLLGR